jgi:[CysO sulfur-carrier protein]-S-L-cysteine hydrolase
MRIARSMLDQIVAQARAEAPNECCGIVGTRDGLAVTVYPVRNAAASPLRYEIDPKDQLRVFEALDEADLDIGAIYHSHTRSVPEPSQTDINLAFYPDAVYVIVGVAGEQDDVRAWHIRDGTVTTATLDVEEG